MIWNRQRKVRVATQPLEGFLRRVEQDLGVPTSAVSVCLISDSEMARLNQTFRKKKGPTDVLSFLQENSFSPLATRHSPLRGFGVKSRANAARRSRESEPAYLGDIAIAPETARRYAKKNGRSLHGELRVLILHGVLHLLGYDHETDRGEMDRLEQKLRRRFGLV